MAVPQLLSAAKWWLVEHPTVASFEWDDRLTWAASPRFPAAVVAAYLSVTFLLRGLLLSRSGPPLALRRLVRVISPSTTSSSSSFPSSWPPAAAWVPPPRCLPPPGSSIYEFVDTLLIVLASDWRRLSFLHVYHHAAVVGVCYQWLSARQSLLPVGLVTNASVHVVMYAYYLCSSLGWRWSPRWKRAVTTCQIVQFCFSFAVSLVFFWLHFFGAGGKGCSGGIRGWAQNGAFNASLLTLFFNFHRVNYNSSKLKANGKAH
ncbi:unnamed protein product [Spirodela intermedia]|uniref:very-long-chain 3-oxoacyl-CoA synthase n=1 Tax=Spirodela intermedia TaxID=51605 RepID=A0A7I8J6B0_SPIIN|nr:unnamed protein product [Spirodela intermedia]CAA6664943.1 unnamed protein product [Spirodela intermedia]